MTGKDKKAPTNSGGSQTADFGPIDQSDAGKSQSKPVDTVTLSLEEWAEWRKAAGLHINPDTAEVRWDYRQVLDPYCVWPEMPDECQCVGRAYFARSPGMSVWIEFADLPRATRDALWQKHESELAFPAGLDFIPFALDYLERNFGPTSSLSNDELGQVMITTYEAYLAEKTGREEAHDDSTEDR